MFLFLSYLECCVELEPLYWGKAWSRIYITLLSYRHAALLTVYFALECHNDFLPVSNPCVFVMKCMLLCLNEPSNVIYNQTLWLCDSYIPCTHIAVSNTQHNFISGKSVTPAYWWFPRFEVLLVVSLIFLRTWWKCGYMFLKFLILKQKDQNL